MHYTTLISTINFSLMNSWQLGLVCGLSVLFFGILCILIGYLYRCCSRTKRIDISCEYLFDDKKFMQKSELPQSQIFQRAVRVPEPKQSINTTISWIHDGCIRENYVNLRPPRPSKPGIFLDHSKIHDPRLPSNRPSNPTESIYTTNNHAKILLRKASSATHIPGSVCKTSMNPLKLVTDGMEEQTFDESDSITLERSQEKASLSDSKHYTNMSFIDESLHDEDAWLSILAVANAELDLLNRLENDHERIITIM